jgi:predicted Zn-dependent peptidase
MKEPLVARLRNGIRVVHQPMDREAAHCGIMIGAGSRDEKTSEHGLAHFLEHCLFKGTEKRKTHHILSRLDSVGGELNAFTSKEETWIHGSFLRQHYQRAIEIIYDISFHATFPDHEIEKEKEVILDEINSYKDSPADMIFEEFDALIFGKHPIGRSILGTEKSLRSFTKNDLLNFHRRHFHPDQLIFASAGNIDFSELIGILNDSFGAEHLEGKRVARKGVPEYIQEQRSEKKDIHQTHFVMGCPAYHYDHPFRPGLYLLNNILGGPAMNSKLNMTVREKHGIAYSVDSNYAPFSDCGVFSVYVGTESQNLEKAKKLIWNELLNIAAQPLSIRQLHDAKRQLIGQIGLAQDSGAALMFNNAKSLLMFNRIDTMPEVYKKIDKISAKELQRIAVEIFNPARMSSITYEAQPS